VRVEGRPGDAIDGTVTADHETLIMRYHISRTGVCIVRIESERDRVLITVRTNADIAQLSAERVIVVTDVEAAANEVREFLALFARTTCN
jgi:hypothetical protein